MAEAACDSADVRDEIADSLDGLAIATAPPVSSAISLLARFTRAEWPEASEIPGILATAEALSQLESSSSAALEEAISRTAEAETVRASASAVLAKMIDVVDSPPSSELSAMRDRVAALESQLINARARGDRLAQDVLELRRESSDARARQSAAEAEKEGVQRRLGALEYSLSEVHKLLELAAALAPGSGAAISDGAAATALEHLPVPAK